MCFKTMVPHYQLGFIVYGAYPPVFIAIDKGTFLCHIVKAVSKIALSTFLRAPVVL